MGVSMAIKSRGPGEVPQHVALIPDGNRRWSRENKLKTFNGYEVGIKKFIDFSVWLKGFGVKTLTVWALSIDNISSRNGAELSALYGLYIKAANDPDILEKLDANRSRVNIIGNLSLLPAGVRAALRKVEKRTKGYGDFTINLLIAYGGRYDLSVAVKRITQTGMPLDEGTIQRNLLTSSIPDADMIIRTSGEQRLSGFLPWQSAYSELYFSKKYWPDFQKQDLDRAMRDFSSRSRRFGR
jgi:undecaprenyl diphosphate synthase